MKPKTHLRSTAQRNIVWSYYLEPNTLEQRSTAKYYLEEYLAGQQKRCKASANQNRARQWL